MKGGVSAQLNSPLRAQLNYPSSFNRSKQTVELVIPCRRRLSRTAVYPLITVFSDFCPVRPCGVALKPFCWRRRNLDLVIPVRRSSSARLMFSIEKASPRDSFISLMACVIMSLHKSLPMRSFIRLLS